MLWREAMAARHFRRDRARCKGFHHDPCLDLVAPAPAPPRALRLRSVDYMLDHICEPLCARRVTYCRSPRHRQRGDRGPLTKDHARSLLLFALRTSLKVSREIGSFGVITHPNDDQVRAFYGLWGFQDLPFDPRRAMIVRMIDLERSGVGP